MRWYYKAILAIIIVLIIASSSGTIYYYNRINNVYDDDMLLTFDDANYHFSLILKSDEDVYWQNFKEGVYEAAKEYSSAVEYNPINDILANDKMVDYIKIAIKSQVDGIIVNGDGTSEYEEAVNLASKINVPVVLGGVESVDSTRLSYVGTNFYEYGISAAKLISRIPIEAGIINYAVILSSPVSDEGAQSIVSQNDTMISGMVSVTENIRNMNLITTQYRKSDLLGAEDLTRSILTQCPDIDAIFCVNARDTMAAARVIVERNLVGKVYIVGTDMTEGIVKYINKGIIFGVLDRNGYEAGYKCIETLIKDMEESFQPSYEDIDIDTYTLTNIAKYHKR